MRKFWLSLVLMLMASAMFGQAKPVVVVELFTSEGCSSCPPADALFRDLQKKGFPNVDLVLLGEHVDYWNHLGWRDAFSSGQFTDRQADYVAKLRIESAYTPQAVVDGHAELVGNDEGALGAAITRAARQAKPLRVNVKWDAASQTVQVTTEGNGTGLLVVAFTEDGLSSAVKAGENGGHTLAHAAVVRRLIDVGTVQGATSKEVKQQLDASWNKLNLHISAFVQDEKSGQILGAGSTKIGG
jgi:hypothetical protein